MHGSGMMIPHGPVSINKRQIPGWILNEGGALIYKLNTLVAIEKKIA